MRGALFLTALLAVPAMAHDENLAEAMARASAGVFVPMQMPDGSQLWRWSGKELKGSDVELRYTDVLAQGMAKALWCPRGWEEIKRTPASGMLIIEGRCK